jgi:hypothetical protein
MPSDQSTLLTMSIMMGESPPPPVSLPYAFGYAAVNRLTLVHNVTHPIDLGYPTLPMFLSPTNTQMGDERDWKCKRAN